MERGGVRVQVVVRIKKTLHHLHNIPNSDTSCKFIMHVLLSGFSSCFLLLPQKTKNDRKSLNFFIQFLFLLQCCRVILWNKILHCRTAQQVQQRNIMSQNAPQAHSSTPGKIDIEKQTGPHKVVS